MGQNKNKKNGNNNSNDEIILKKIKCNKKVCDIADFFEMWTEFEVKNKRKDKPYNAVSHNCQQFALHLFKYLVGAHYPEKVIAASKQTQSPHDIKAYKKEAKQEEQNEQSKKKKQQQQTEVSATADDEKTQ